jgi:hypothetical protein
MQYAWTDNSQIEHFEATGTLYRGRPVNAVRKTPVMFYQPFSG